MSIRQVIERLIAAGLDSIPGGGAEILDDEIRYQISPLKCSTDTWLDVMREAHGLGLRTTATMVFGFGEQPRHIVGHFERLRALQDETSGFTAFICWPFQAEGTRLKLRDDTTAMRYLRVFALSRLYLDNFPSLQVSWPTMGPEVGQVALRFGGNDFGSAMIEENVVSQAGAIFKLGADDIERYIRARRLHAPPAQHALRATGRRVGQEGGRRVKLLSARWVVPIARPPIAEGAVALADDGTVLARRQPRRAARRVPRRGRGARARASLLPGPGQRALPPGAVRPRRRRPGRQGPVRLGDGADARAQAPTPPDAAARGRRDGRGRRRRAAAPRPSATSATRWRRRPAIGRAGPGGRAVPRAVRLARGRDRRRAGRRRARARRGRRRLAGAPRLRPRAARPLLRRSRAARAHLRGGRRRRARHLDPRRRGRRRARAAARRLRPLARAAGRHGRRSRRRACPRKTPVAYLASLGAFETDDAAAARPHGARRRRRSAPRPRGRRDRRALPALEPAHRRPPARRRRVRRRRPAARDRHRQPGVRARSVAVGRDGDAGRALPGRPGGALAGRRHARRRARPRPARLRHARARRAPGRARRAGRRHRRARSNRWCATRPRPCAGWRAHDRHAP